MRPAGSLVWASDAALRIGVDVLAARYADEFPDILEHGMVYVTATERRIPLPSGLVDVMFSMNALDHVADFPAMCSEILRVLKPGGLLAASVDLDEMPTPEEPQRLTEELMHEHLLAGLRVEGYRCGDKIPGEIYREVLRGDEAIRTPGRPGILWVRARKPGG